MIQQQTKAFTLVELIVVITILAILGTIAFISFTGYSKSSRDSVRISDINSIEKTLELFSLETGYYPEPNDPQGVTYSGAEVWSQGTIGDRTISILSKLNKKPVDPLTGSEYTYSRLNTKKEIEIATVLENGEISQISNSYAGDKVAIAYVTGNYNGLLAKVQTGSKLYVLAVPSIINGDISLSDYQDLLDANKLVISGGDVLPDSYAGTTFNTDGIFDLGLENVVVYSSGTSLPSTQDEVSDFVLNLQNSYSGTTISNNSQIVAIVETTDYNSLLVLGAGIVESIYDEVVELTLAEYSCDTQPGYTNTSFVTGDPTQTGESWQNTNNTNACYYECTGGYTGNDCSIAPPIITQSLCNSAGWLWVNDYQDAYIGTSRGNGFCISPAVGDFGTGIGNGISWNGWGNYSNGSNAFDYNGWDPTSIDDSGNSQPGSGQTRKLDSESGYTCKALGTAGSDYDTTDDIVGRMKWLDTYKSNRSELISIDWVSGATPPNGSHPTPALYIADCIDGVKDLTTDFTYTHNDNSTDLVTYGEYSTNVLSNTDDIDRSNVTYQNRQKYLIAWTQKSGSHLPSAFSNITSGHPGGCLGTNCDGNLNITDKGEYQMAVLTGLMVDIDRIWMAGIGDTDGSHWGRKAVVLGKVGVNDISYEDAGAHNGNYATRFVIRP